MAFNRTIKVEFFTSSSVTTLPFEARLFFEATWLEADREGRFKWNPATLKNRYFPADDVDVEAMGKALEGNDLIKFYTVDKTKYAVIPNFKAHQYINNKERASILPEPPVVKNSIVKNSNSSSYTSESRVYTPLSRVETLPSFLPKEKWEEYLQFRVEKKEPMTERAEKMALKRLTEFHGKGHDPLRIIEDSIISNWSGLFEPRGGTNLDHKQDHDAAAEEVYGKP